MRSSHTWKNQLRMISETETFLLLLLVNRHTLQKRNSYRNRRNNMQTLFIQRSLNESAPKIKYPKNFGQPEFFFGHSENFCRIYILWHLFNNFFQIIYVLNFNIVVFIDDIKNFHMYCNNFLTVNYEFNCIYDKKDLK